MVIFDFRLHAVGSKRRSWRYGRQLNTTVSFTKTLLMLLTRPLLLLSPQPWLDLQDSRLACVIIEWSSSQFQSLLLLLLDLWTQEEGRGSVCWHWLDNPTPSHHYNQAKNLAFHCSLGMQSEDLFLHLLFLTVATNFWSKSSSLQYFQSCTPIWSLADALRQ